ncbi:MAG: serine hydrolase [Candidatus Lindowbacteria bacterium]|nr:serine hydrolase [Candidatus Lindowbacteria bacterium]
MRILWAVFAVALAAATLFVIGMCAMLSPTHVARCLLYRNSDIKDYEKFPSREVNNEPPVFSFKKEANNSIPPLFGALSYTFKGKQKKVGQLDEFLESTGSTAFIVIKDDTILYEKYFNGYNRDSINTSFSMAKSFDSTLVGIAIDEGLIKSVDEPITNYIPELKAKGFESITIKHLLTMASGIKYRENGLPWGDDALTYYFPNLRKLALTAQIEAPPGRHFLYDNYHPLLIGMILERATRRPVAKYLEEKIWKPLGMEFPASWSIDSKKTAFEKMESGINARSIDFAKFGRLFLNRGLWDGKRIISEKWVIESTSPMPVNYREYYNSQEELFLRFFKSGKGFYKYFWWGYAKDGGDYDFLAGGRYGQFIYVCPQKNVIIVRNGAKLGNIDNWKELLYDMANRL